MAPWVLILWLGGYTAPVTIDMPSKDACVGAIQRMENVVGRGPSGTLWGYCMKRE